MKKIRIIYRDASSNLFPKLLQGFLIIISLGILLFGFVKNDPNTTPEYLPSGWINIEPVYDVNSIIFQNDTVWIGGKGGVWAIDRINGQTLFNINKNQNFEIVRTLLIDSTGVLWIGHTNGLTKYHKGEFETLTTDQGIPHNHVRSIVLDNSGQLWIGTWNGAAKLNEGNWESITTDDGLVSNMVNVIFPASDGSIWFGSYMDTEGGVSLLKNSIWRHITKKEGLPHPSVTSITEDQRGNIWVGTGLLNKGGAIKLENTKNGYKIKETINIDDGLVGEKVRQIFINDNGALWFGSEYDGLTILVNRKYIPINKGYALPHNEVKVIVKDADNFIWLGTNEGLSRLSPEAIFNIETKQ